MAVKGTSATAAISLGCYCNGSTRSARNIQICTKDFTHTNENGREKNKEEKSQAIKTNWYLSGRMRINLLFGGNILSISLFRSSHLFLPLHFWYSFFSFRKCENRIYPSNTSHLLWPCKIHLILWLVHSRRFFSSSSFCRFSVRHKQTMEEGKEEREKN